MNKIHPTAIVEDGALIGDDVTIEAYAVVKSNVTVDDGATIKSHAYIDGYTFIGAGTTIYPFASIGTKCQDLKYKGEKTFVRIGKNCEIREFVTINSSCQENSSVSIGDHCLLMAYCHVAHNCTIGHHVIMSNNATLAGHVLIEDHAIIGGFTPIHQWVRIGSYAMLGGMSRIGQDLPPYTIGGGIPFKMGGLNLIGLKRHGFSLPLRRQLALAFKILYRSNLGLEEALQRIESEMEPLAEIHHFVNFCRKTERGIICLTRDAATAEQDSKEEEEEALV